MKGRLLADLGHHLRELERFGVFQREIAHTKTCVRPEMIIQYKNFGANISLLSNRKEQ